MGSFVDQQGNALTSVFGLAYGQDGNLYATQQYGGSNNDTQIWKVNTTPVNGKIELTKIGTGVGLHNSSAINTHAMNIAPDGTMYTWDLGRDIFTVDLTTGVATYVASTNVDSTGNKLTAIMDIAYSPDGAAYACANQKLYKIEADRTTTTIGSLGANIMGLSFDPDGTLYRSSFATPGKLYTINTSNAAVTEIAGSFGTQPHGGDIYIAYSGWAGSDTTAPTLSSSTPADDATAVAIDANIVLNFSETVAAGTGDFIIKKTADDTTVATIPVTDGQVSISGSTVTINLSTDLDYSTGYYVEIASGVLKDSSNNDFAGISGSTTLNLTTDAAPNNAPAGTDKTITINEDGSHTFTASDFGFSDTDSNNLSAVIISSLPAAGSLTLNGNAVSANESVAAADITNLVFSPAADANGTAYTSFSFQVKDDGGTANGGVDIDPSANIITFNVTAVDDPAVVSSGTTGSGAEDASTITGTLVASDVEGLTSGTDFSVAETDQPANGTASIDPETGAWTYTPNSGFSGEDIFTVTITDDLSGTTPQTVTITVIALPAPAPSTPTAPAVVDNTPVDPAPAGTNIQSPPTMTGTVSRKL